MSADRRPETPWRIVNPSSADGFSIVKKAYSEAPWRIVNQYGAEVAFEFEITDPLTGRVHLMAIGYRTKNEAVTDGDGWACFHAECVEADMMDAAVDRFLDPVTM